MSSVGRRGRSSRRRPGTTAEPVSSDDDGDVIISGQQSCKWNSLAIFVYNKSGYLVKSLVQGKLALKHCLSIFKINGLDLVRARFSCKYF